ncbi:MAG TPA: hypothetical protein VGK45_13250 [Thermoanaerobaculia bacterium]
MRKTMVLTTLLILLVSVLAFAHGGHPHVLGTVTALTADHIEVKTKEGKTVSVPLTKTTKFLQGDQPATAADAKVGSRVVVHLGEGGAAVEVHLPALNPSPAGH